MAKKNTQSKIGVALIVIGLLGLLTVLLTQPFALSTGGARGLSFAEFDTPVLDPSKFDVVDPAGDFGSPAPLIGSCTSTGDCLALLPLPEEVAQLCKAETENGKLFLQNCPTSTANFDRFAAIPRTITRTFTPGGEAFPTSEGKTYQVILNDPDTGEPKDWWGQDLRVPLTITNGKVIVVVGDFDKPDYQEIEIKESGIFEIIPQELNPSETRILHNDQELATIIVDDDEQFNVAFHSDGGGIFLERINFEPQFSCKLRNGEIKVDQDFPGGQEINIFDLAYPVVRFCEDPAPALIIDSQAQGTFPSVALARELANGETISIPSHQRLELTYVIRNQDSDGNPLIEANCDPSSEKYDLATDTCEPTIGTLKLCDGQLVSGDCFSQIAEDDCEKEGGNFNEDGICVIRIPSEEVACDSETFDQDGVISCEANKAECQLGFKRVDLESGSFKCIPEDSAIPAGLTDNVIAPAVETTQELTGTTQDNSISILLAIISVLVLIFGALLMFNAKRKGK